MASFTIPIIKGRRKTTLPAGTTRYEITGLSNIVEGSFAEAMRREFEDVDLHRELHREFWKAAFQADPWDEAVKWIEQRKAADAEWPWPKR